MQLIANYAIQLPSRGMCAVVVVRNFVMLRCVSIAAHKQQESPANAKGTRDISACMKAHCEQM